MGFDIFIQQTEKGRGVFASRCFRKGETVVVGRRVDILPQRTTHSIQMDFDLHIKLDEPALSIDHSCSPNTGVRNNQFGAYHFVALVDIPSGSEITFDYETTEYSLSQKSEVCPMPTEATEATEASSHMRARKAIYFHCYSKMLLWLP